MQKFEEAIHTHATFREVMSVLMKKEYVYRWLPKLDFECDVVSAGEKLAANDKINVKKGMVVFSATIVKVEEREMELRLKGSVVGVPFHGSAKIQFRPGEQGTDIRFEYSIDGLFAHLASDVVRVFFQSSMRGVRSIAETEQKRIKDWLAKQPLV